ncbi:MAG TPA: DUF4142 domain-containing protein [Ramlibacter sp.]|nr:DUF4142 domain-containing protein [Ramlibacter sp.]
MSKAMNGARQFLALGVAAAAALVAGCSSVHLPPVASRPATVVVAPLAESERAFLTRVAAKSMYEVEVSRLAATRATDPRVRAYAQMLVSRHEQANGELIALMSAKGVPPPAGLTAKNATKLHRLASLPASPEFDKGYVRVVGIEDHAAIISQFEKVRATARDRDLKAWIDRTLPMLRSQLAVAQTLASTIAA